MSEFKRLGTFEQHGFKWIAVMIDAEWSTSATKARRRGYASAGPGYRVWQS